MSETKSPHSGLTRRNFLGSTAAVVGAAALVGGTSLDALADNGSAADSGEQIFAGACRCNCMGQCHLNVHVRDGKVVQTSMRPFKEPEYNRICMKGLTHPMRIYNPDRIKYPLRRVEGTERGAGEWERISWDEAIDEILTKWKQFSQESGSNSLAFWAGTGNFASVSGTMIVPMGTAAARFTNAIGGTRINNTCDQASSFAWGNVLGTGPNGSGSEPADMLNARTIVVWGANPMAAQLHNAHFMLEAQKKGAKLVVIDPVFNQSAAKADLWVPLRPGSDGLLAFGLIKIIVEEGLVDEEFIRNSSDAPFLVKESDGMYLRLSDVGIPPTQFETKTVMNQLGLPEEVQEAVNEPVVYDLDQKKLVAVSQATKPAYTGITDAEGIAVRTPYDLLMEQASSYSLEEIAEVTQVSVETMGQLVDLYARNTPSSFYQQFGLDRYTNGYYAARLIAIIAVLTGQLGKKGTNAGQFNLYGTNFINLAGTMVPEGAPGETHISVLKLPEVMADHKYGNQDLQIRSVYVSCGDVINNHLDRNKSIELFKEFEFVVVADMNMNETAQYADIVLPVAHWFEVDDIQMVCDNHPYVMLQEKAIEPLYEAKSDYELFQTFAEGMGVGDALDMTEHEYMELLLDTDGARELGMTLENLKKEKAIRAFPGNAADDPYVHGAGGVFPTATGRAHLYVETPVPNFDWGQEVDVDAVRVPKFFPPSQAWYENELHEKYPLSVIQDHTRYRTHSQWWDVDTLREIMPENYLSMSAQDAADRGIQDGDLVKAYNDHGCAVLKAVIHNGLRPGMVAMPKGYEKFEYIDGHYNELTTYDSKNDYAANCYFFDVLVEVEKYEGGE